MELIEVSGYITEEKIEIAKRHLVPRELQNTGLAKKRHRETQLQQGGPGKDY